MNYFIVPVKLTKKQIFQTGMSESELKSYAEELTAA